MAWTQLYSRIREEDLEVLRDTCSKHNLPISRFVQKCVDRVVTSRLVLRQVVKELQEEEAVV